MTEEFLLVYRILGIRGDGPGDRFGTNDELVKAMRADIRPLAHHGYSAAYLRQCLEVQARRTLTRVLAGVGTDQAAQVQGDTL